MLSSLIPHFLQVTEEAAIACSVLIGKGDRKGADKLATEAMRASLNGMPLSVRVVIGEGERDKAPMLFIGEELGTGGSEVDIAVDPLEGTNLAATDAPNAITVMAIGPRGTLLHAPDTYMDRIVVGPKVKEILDLDAPVRDNLEKVARGYNIPLSEVVVMVLDRPRNFDLIQGIRQAGAKIRLIGDGDIIACVMSMMAEEMGVHASFGIGAAPEATISACLTKACGGQFHGRLKPYDTDMKILQEDVVKRLSEMGITDLEHVYTEQDLVQGEDLLFVATGVTRGDVLKGVVRSAGVIETESLVVFSKLKTWQKIMTKRLM